MYYGNQQQAKVNLAHVLENKGWKLFGFKEDRSDSQTDYFDPERWEGIATKNGLTIVVDIYGNSYSGEKVYKTTYQANTKEIDDKMVKVQALIDRGATDGERAAASNRMKKLAERRESELEKTEKSKVLSFEYPVYNMHPTKRTKWHLEKNGDILASGCSLYTLYYLPDYYDLSTMTINTEYYSRWRDIADKKDAYTPNKDQQKAINLLEKIVKQVEKIAKDFATVNISDGTVEGEKEGLEQSKNHGYKKVTKEVKKMKLQMVEVTDRETPQAGDYITLPNHGHYWLVTDRYDRKGVWNGVEETKEAISYQIVGAASRGFKQLKNPSRYYQYVQNLKDVKIYELKNVEVITIVEKMVKVSEQKAATKKVKPAVKKTEKGENTDKPEKKVDETINAACKIAYNDEKNGIELSFEGKPSKEIRTDIKAQGFRWHGVKKIWYAKNTNERKQFVEDYFNVDSNGKISETGEVNKVNPEVKKEVVFQKFTIEHNKEMNGLEIRFLVKPPAEQIATLKVDKFRYHKVKNMWYAKYNEDLYGKMKGRLDEIIKLSENKNGVDAA